MTQMPHEPARGRKSRWFLGGLAAGGLAGAVAFLLAPARWPLRTPQR